MRRLSRLAVGVALVALVGCASSRVTDSWVAPGAGPIAFEKTLVIVMHPVEGVRRIGENRLVQRLGRGRAVASHTLISMDDVRDTDAARSAIAGAGFDGAILMRVVGQGQQLTYEPGMVYPSEYGQFWGFYGHVSSAMYATGYMRSDRFVSVETNVYSVEDERLLWSGVSQAFDPLDVGGTVDDVADAVSKELRRVGLLD